MTEQELYNAIRSIKRVLDRYSYMIDPDDKDAKRALARARAGLGRIRQNTVTTPE